MLKTYRTRGTFEAVPWSPWCLAAALAVAVQLACPRPGIAGEPLDPRSLRMIADFNDGVQNFLGGYYNKFESPPSSAATFLSPEIFRGGGGRSLRVEAHQKPGGFCGVWMHLYDFRAEERRYFDTRNYAFLSFWIRGEAGGEKFTVKMADEHWIGIEDSVPLGPVDKYLPGGVTTNWQEVLVPLAEATTLDRMNMGGLTLDFTEPGDHTVYLDDVCVKTTPKIATPEADSAAVGAEPVVTTYPRAMWVWHTKPLLMDAAQRKTLFDFCREENVDTLWMQILSRSEPGVDAFLVPTGAPPTECRVDLEYPDELRAFLREAHGAGVKVHGLDGYPEYVQKECHPVPLGIVDAVIAFNRESEPEERYDGIHFDNEPYLLIGWHDKARREEILKEFLDLNKEIQRRVRTEPGLVFGVDIPFWFQARNDQTGEIAGMATYNGVRKAASYHCIDLLDNVGIMDYRDAADGADGIIVHAADLLDYADQANGAKVYIGVETFTYPLIDVWFVVGLPHELFEKMFRGAGGKCARLSRVRDLRTQMFDDGANIHVGVELPPEPTPEQDRQLRGALADIAGHFSAASHPALREKVDSIRMDAEFGVSGNVEWTNPRKRDIDLGEGQAAIPGFVATSIMLPKITFADETYEYMQEQLRASEAEFVRHKSFAGMAIHFYDTYRQMRLDSEKKGTP
ncbi:MAG: hypothetical protein JXB04_13050 [Kiritimatiellae bacterium]|nr:hypothetical protein [Kiritimatiellia bacterium]